MKKYLLIFLFFLLNYDFTYSQCVNDTYYGYGGTSNDQGHVILADTLQNIYLSGYFTDSIQLGGFNLTSDSIGQFLCKISPAGNVLWAKNLFNSFDNYYALFYYPILKIDYSGQLIVAGACSTANAYFDTISNAFINGDLFVAKFNSVTGELNSFLSTGRHLYAYVEDMDIDENNNVYLAGSFVGLINFGGISMSCVGQTNSFLVKFDSQNQALWADRITTFPTTTGNRAYSIDYDKSNNIYISGWYGLNADFGNGITLNSTSYTNGFIAKYNLGGNIEWAKTSDTNKIYFQQVLNDSNSVTVVEAPPDIFVNYNQNGDTVWTKTVSNGSFSSLFTQIISFKGKYFGIGNFQNSLILDGNVYASPGNNIFISRFDSSVALEGLIIIKSSNSISSKDISIDQQQNIYLTGMYGSPDTINSTVIMPWWGSGEILCVKLCNAATGIINEILSTNSFLTIFPNPVNSSFIINYQNAKFETIEVIIHNALGEEVYYSKEDNMPKVFFKEINVKPLNNGIYFLRLKNKGGSISKKFIVQK